MLFNCWSTDYDARPTLQQHWVSASCLLDMTSACHRGEEGDLATQSVILHLPHTAD